MNSESVNWWHYIEYILICQRMYEILRVTIEWRRIMRSYMFLIVRAQRVISFQWNKSNMGCTRALSLFVSRECLNIRWMNTDWTKEKFLLEKHIGNLKQERQKLCEGLRGVNGDEQRQLIRRSSCYSKSYKLCKRGHIIQKGLQSKLKMYFNTKITQNMLCSF